MAAGDDPFHAHIYFMPEQRGAAENLRRRLAADPAVLFTGRMMDEAVGPHPIGQFEVHFTAASVPHIRDILEQSGLRSLIHPLTDDDVADHTTLAHWIGEPLNLDQTVLDPPGHNQGVARFGKSDF